MGSREDAAHLEAACTIVRRLTKFLHLASYYSNFIPGFTTSPVPNLLKKNKQQLLDRDRRRQCKASQDRRVQYSRRLS